MRPRIGITTSLESDTQHVDHAYIRAVEDAAGLPVIVPMLRKTVDIKVLADLLDGLVITGGPAITEGLIGTLPDDIDKTAPLRIKTDTALAEMMLAQQKPILGICYGMQLLNAIDGGTIYADVENQVDGTWTHSSQRNASNHALLVHSDSRLYQLLETRTTEANTRHIQAVASVGPSYNVAAVAPDGVVEAIEHESGLHIGVQFHPERMPEQMAPLFEDLIQKAQLQRTGTS